MKILTAIIVYVDEQERLYVVKKEFNNIRPINKSNIKYKRFCGSKMLENAQSYIRYLKTQRYINAQDFCDIEEI